MSLRKLLGSRFGHFAAPPSPAATSADDDDDDAKRAAKKAEEDEEAKRKAEEEEEARRSRRSRRAKKRTRGRHEDNDDDDGDDTDEAGDDDEDEDDEEEMKKAATSGHTFALSAAFRSGARAQRRRCAAIFAHQAAAANPVLAMSLAFETSMTAGAAIAVLEKTPALRGGTSLHHRMAGSQAGGIRVPAAAPDGPRGAAAIAMSWDQAMKDVAPGR